MRPLVFAWDQFGPYHMDRLEALGRHFAGRLEVIGIELVREGEIYGWKATGPGRFFRKLTLCPGWQRSEVSTLRHCLALVRACLATGAREIFLCDFQLAAIFLAAATLRLLGKRVVVMQDSKFDDKPRRLLRELGKFLLYRPYDAALAGSPRAKAYLEFLGLPPARVAVGYDTIALDRMTMLAEAEDVPQSERHFTVIARFVPQKNIAAAIDAYALYRKSAPEAPRELHLCGAGPLDADLRARAASIPGIRFRGFLQEREIAATLAKSLALLLPSFEEPFGLVVNEAIALGVPVLLSPACGAAGHIVANGVNGYVVEPDNIAGLAHFMALLDRDGEEWRRLAHNTRQFRQAADVVSFVAAVERVLVALDPAYASSARALVAAPALGGEE
jgi:glycosyltransferase involved in cell wall biosynthesis